MPLLVYGVDGAVYHAWAMSPSAWEEAEGQLPGSGSHCSLLRGGGRSRPLANRLAILPPQPEHGLRRSREPRAHRLQIDHGACGGPAGAGGHHRARADDGTWVADVLVRHPDWRVALEAQLSRIPLAAIQDRQERYRQAGIRGAWLVWYGIARLAAQRDLPLFRLEVKQAESIEPAVIGSTTNGAPARTDLAEFTEKLLTGRVWFEGLPPEASAPSVATVPSVCWKCCRDIDLVVALINLPGAHGIRSMRHPAGARSRQTARGVGRLSDSHSRAAQSMRVAHHPAAPTALAHRHRHARALSLV